MFRKLTEDDRQRVIDYISREPAYNVFIFGDIENFGFDSDFQDVWADFDGSGTYRAVLLRFYNHFIVYSEHGEFDRDAVCDHIGLNQSGWILSGKEQIVTSLSEILGLSTIRHQYLAALSSIDDLVPTDINIPVEWVTKETLDDLIGLHASIEEFHDIDNSTKSFKHNFETGTGRSVMVRHNNKPVSSASSAAENSQSAMIIGVCTLSEFRNRGYATLCMERLCRVLLDENKTICLFYDNPAAGRIYKHMGFHDISRWSMTGVSG